MTELDNELQAMGQLTEQLRPLLNEASELGMVVLSDGKVELASPPTQLAPFINVLRSYPPGTRISMTHLCNEVTRLYKVSGKLRPTVDEAKNLGWISISPINIVELIYTST
jgi:hypothetical protein